MSLVPLDALSPVIQAGRPVLGLDLGSRTIGLAIADRLGMTATPLMTLTRSKFTKDAARLRAFNQERAVGGWVVGLPLSLDGHEGPGCQSARSFIDNYLQIEDLPIALWDERLSTAAVNRLMIAADYSRAKRARLVDGMAAAYILQGALDRLRNLRQSGQTADQTG